MTFQELQAHWYRKLKDEGFVDIEATSYDSERQKLRVARAYSSEQREARQEYYRRAREFTHTLPVSIDRQVWELHAEGQPMRDIAESIGLCAATVFKRIKRLRAQAGI